MVEVRVQPGRFGAPTRRIAAQQLGEIRRFRRGAPVRKREETVRRLREVKAAKAQPKFQSQEISKLDVQKGLAQTELDRLKARKASGVVTSRGDRGILNSQINEKVSEIRAINSVTNRLRQGQVFAVGDIGRFIKAEAAGARSRTLEAISERGRAELSPTRRFEVEQKLARGEGKKVLEFAQRQTITIQEAQQLSTRQRRALGIEVPTGEGDMIETRIGRTGERITIRTQAPQELEPQIVVDEQPTIFQQRLRTFTERAARLSPIGIVTLTPGLRRKRTGFEAAIARGLTPQTREELALTAVTAGVGAGFGVAVKGLGLGLTTIGSRFGTRGVLIGAEISRGATVTGGVALSGAFAAAKAEQFKQLETAEEIGLNIGSTARELAAFGTGAAIGGRIAERTAGRLATIGLREIAAEEVIAPEFLRGQTFPAIRRGQTAGQLRQEFFEPVLPGERPGVPRAFAARPEPFTRVTPSGKPRRGELEGTFAAPRLSPEFTRVGAREPRRLFGFEEAARAPVIGRLTVRDIEFAPGITPRTRAPRRPRFDPAKLSEEIAETGRAVLPFQKAEKEIIIGRKSLLARERKRFFITFRGRRIPIKEADVLATEVSIAAQAGARPRRITTRRRTVRDLAAETEASISRLARRDPLITPSRIGGIRRRPTAISEVSRLVSDASRLPASDLSRITARDLSRLTSDISRPRPRRGVSRPRALTSAERLVAPGRRVSGLSRIDRELARATDALPIRDDRLRIRRQSGAFDVFVGQGAKKKKIGNDLPFGKALKRGATFVEQNIAATFTLRKDPGKKPKGKDVRFSLNNEVFRKSRRPNAPALRFVERKNKRLNVGREVDQINVARRKAMRMIP